MSRRIATRFKVKGTLLATAPLHVGGMGGGVDADLTLAEDGQGRPYVPGTSLAGAFRGWMEQRFPKDVEALWGSEPAERRQGAADRGHASHVLIEDGIVTLPTGVVAEIREGVGIDRQWGSAAERIKYNRTVLPRGSKVDLEMTVDVPRQNGTDRVAALLGTLMRALEQEEISLGAAKTRGLGRVKLQGTTVRRMDLLAPQGMLAALAECGTTLQGPLEAATDLETRPGLTITIEWQPDGPLMVKAEGEGVAVDMLPLLGGVEGKLALVLPGSSIKGALRNQAERIVRTVRNTAVQSDLDPRKRFLSQISVPLVDELFGSPERLAALSVDDCYGAGRVDPSAWARVQAAKDDPALRDALNDTDLATAQQVFHVGVDRWTGGAAKGFLYNVLEPYGVAWDPLVLRLDLTRLQPAEQEPAIALLLLTLRDLAEGRIPLGFAVNRGMGAVKISNVRLSGRDLGADICDLEGVSLSNGRLVDLPSDLRTRLTSKWQSWIDKKPQGAKP